jgi:quinol monooxygenase YgiN
VILIIGTIRVPPERLDDARPIMARMIAASRSEDGCIRYAYAQDVLEPDLIHVSEAWRDREALARHFKTDHIAAWRAEGSDLGLHDRNLSLYETPGPEPL